MWGRRKKNYPRSKCKKNRKQNRGLCDCCIEAMRSIITQLVGQTIAVRSANSFIGMVPPQPIVNRYLTRLSGGEIISICQILYLAIDSSLVQELVLEPIRRDEGKCGCCEDPMTEFINQNVGNVFVFTFSNAESTVAQILRVGEGIVILASNEGTTLVASTCKLDSIRPL